MSKEQALALVAQQNKQSADESALYRLRQLYALMKES